MSPKDRSRAVKTIAQDLGFDQCGLARADPIGREDYVRSWLDAGKAGSMQYLHRYLDKRLDPGALIDGAKSVIIVAVLYNQPPQGPRKCSSGGGEVCSDRHHAENSHDERTNGRVAMYAWGEDYHVVVKDKLFALVRRLRALCPGDHRYKVCVDTAPLLEREIACAAGVGWIGKNTMVLNRRLGSFFFLGAVVTTLELVPDEPIESHCGSCTACLDACPTDALSTPFQMDASQCISYLTIEHRGDIEPELAKKTGDWLFGCDICQQVCPFNRQAPMTLEPRLATRIDRGVLDVEEVLAWSEDEHHDRLADSAMNRAKPAMMKRNATIVRENARREG